ncbi:hypothetical protein B566_EDAN015507 [Ephemera danica]|nr:hypothetical protein B566_EDAN015507 [Ephemera danica]
MPARQPNYTPYRSLEQTNHSPQNNGNRPQTQRGGFQGYNRNRNNTQPLHMNTRTSDGSFQYNVLPFGLSISPIEFQRALDYVLGDLSRNPVDTPEANDDLEEIPILAVIEFDITKLQGDDENLFPIIEALKDPSKADTATARKCRSFILENDKLYRKNFSNTGNNKLLVVPTKLIEELICSYHDEPVGGSHLGAKKSISKITKKYWWEGMTKDIIKYVKTCPDCQSKKRSTQASPGLLQPHEIPLVPFQKIGIDGLGSFPKKGKWEKWGVKGISDSPV